MAETLHDRGPAVFVVTLVLIILATVFTVLRLISKWGVTRKATWDDYCTVLAWVFAVGLSVSIMIGTTVGLGEPDSKILPSWQMPLKRSIYAFTVFYNPALMATKTAILILYWRMAAAHPFLRYASLVTMAVVDIAGVVLTFLNIFQCRPVAAAFTDIDGTCIDIVTLYLASAPINILTDLAILLLPLPILTSLRMELRQKVILVATFIVGGFVTIVDVVRIAYLQTALKDEREIDPTGNVTATNRPVNFTYDASFSLMWSAVEVSVGIVCCCILVLKPLVMRIMPALLHGPRRLHTATPESLLRSDISKDPRLLDSLQMSEPPGSPLSAMSTSAPMNLPPSPHAQGTGTLESPLDVPRSPRPPALGVIPEQRQSEDSAAEGGDGDESDGDMDFFQMLASEPPPAPAPIPSLEESRTRRISAGRRPTILSARRPTQITEASQAPTQSFLDFVNMKGKTPLTQLSAREAWWPVMFVSILFFLWGFAYGLLGSLTSEIQGLLQYSPAQAIALHNAYWSAYFFGPSLVGYWVLKREGFKATFITGLAIYACGAMAFWPSSVLRSYPGFFISNFIIALGLSCLEVAANPFIALAGPGHLSEARLNFAQGIQGVGSIISPILAEKALFAGIDQLDLFRVQWCYLAVALFVVALAVLFYYVPLSEASDDDLEAMALQRLYNADMDKGDKAYGIDARRLLLWSGVVLMSMYVGAQEAVSYFWYPFVDQIKPGSDPFWDQAISHAVFAFGRFLAAGLAYFGIPSRHIIAVYIAGAFFFSLLAKVLPQGSAALAMLILVVFFESAIFPTLFAMILRGQGKHTKLASAVTTMAISGGAVWPSVVYGVINLHPDNATMGLVVIIVLYGVSTLWPAMLSSSDTMRRLVDPKWSKRRVARPGEGGESGGAGTVDWSSPRDKPATAHLETAAADDHSLGSLGEKEPRPQVSVIT